MKWFEHCREGLLNLYYSKLRSALALLGILVGTASVVAMVLGGELATHEALKQFKSLGTDLLAVAINDTVQQGNLIPKADNISLAQTFSLPSIDENIESIAPYTQLFHSIFYEGSTLNSMILGVTDSFANIVHIKMRSGRFISLFDRYQFYCVIGKNIYDFMKSVSFREPLGQPIQIGKNIFVVVGVAEDWPENEFVYANINDSILIPLLASTILTDHVAINNIIIRLKPKTNIALIENHLTHFLQQIIPTKQINFRSAKELINKLQNQNNILTVFLGLIGSISLLVGGIGVMNIMLVSVVERKREIGIRLAVGAKSTDIAALFLIEAVILSMLGGIIGVFLGTLIAYVIACIWQWEFVLYCWPIIAGFSISVLAGIFFGSYPAYQAARLDPIEALKVE